MKPNPQIVIIGGGTGSYVVAAGLRDQPVDVTLLMTMVDDGGSNRVIRDEFGLLPTSGIRQAIVALSEERTVLRKLFTYRFHQGGQGLKGMTFGNLFMAAMADLTGSQKAGIEATCNLLKVKGKILPISYDHVQLIAQYEDGSQVAGEHLIDEPQHDGKLKITNLSTQPQAKISAEAKRAILQADLIILGPGDFYTNTIANLVVAGVKESLQQTTAKIVFISNLMTKYGETYNYRLSDFFVDLDKYLPLNLIDYILVNDNLKFPQTDLPHYLKAQSIPVVNDLADYLKKKKTSDNRSKFAAQVIKSDLLSQAIAPAEPGDTLHRSVIRHDSHKLAKEILKLVKL